MAAVLFQEAGLSVTRVAAFSDKLSPLPVACHAHKRANRGSFNVSCRVIPPHSEFCVKQSRKLMSSNASVSERIDSPSAADSGLFPVMSLSGVLLNLAVCAAAFADDGVADPEVPSWLFTALACIPIVAYSGFYVLRDKVSYELNRITQCNRPSIFRFRATLACLLKNETNRMSQDILRL